MEIADLYQWEFNPKLIEGCEIKCPECGESLVLFTTSSGKKMKKCSTAGWDRAAKKPTGCTYVYWLKPGEYTKTDNLSSEGEEFLPPED